GTGVLARDTDLGADISAQHLGRMARLIERRRSFEQGFDDAFQHLSIEVFLALEVVVDVGLGQACTVGDIAGLAGGEALFGKLFAGSAQNQLFVALSDAGHWAYSICYEEAGWPGPEC